MPQEHPLRFQRGIDRRTRVDPVTSERRVNFRRSLGVAWVPLFRDADENAVATALNGCAVLTLESGHILLQPGENNETIYIVLTGTLAVYLDATLRPETAIAIAAGECCGELSAIDGRPVSAFIVAQTMSRVLKVPREVFWDQLMALPKVARNLQIMLSDRVRRSSETMLASQREQLELQHLRKELDVARRLQASMLPLQRPMFPERTDLDICGFMEPTARIGGDLFDAFPIGERHVFFCIGDVSGHGIPAALFMARTIGLLRVLATTTRKPDVLLGILNNSLCVGNDTDIFITLFCAYLDTHSGQLVYSNAGHCAPIVMTGSGTHHLPLPKGPLLGAFAGIRYHSMQTALEPGAMLFCFTDGITEARNELDIEFSEERCLGLLAESGDAPLEMVLDNIRSAVRTFTGTDILEDDCTMLALRRPSA
jgi:sigma-B regulation protein RsbU (phosphoserine phosphatase)